ncbi:MAG TPA: hypothetical protein VK892_20290 [Pyrinomonadaceae bacterium]|nr:hypothetical protein [Pyrinomonadaceae bacterium]
MTQEEFELKRLEQYKDLVSEHFRRLEQVPLSVANEYATGKMILPITKSPSDILLLEKLSQSCIGTAVESKNKPILAGRRNELKFYFERLFEAMLERNGLRIDFEGVIWQNEEPTYLEIKVSREQNINQGSARNLFFQPTANTKIVHSARHLLAGFAVREISEKNWILVNWTIVDLWFLRVRLKPEYNADNLEIYRQEAVLLKGDGNQISYQKEF